MSGTTPWVSKPQKCVPTRPKPIWTSSATHTPPASRTAANASARYPSGGTTCPPHPRSGSQKKAASPSSCFRASFAAFATCSA